MLYNPKKWEPKNEPWRQVLRDAAGLIERHGHTKLHSTDAEGRMCLHGAINVAAGVYSGAYGWDDKGLAGDAHRATARYLDRQGERRSLLHFKGGVPMWASPWNNAPKRQPQEVIDALRAAAEMVEVRR